MMNKQNAVRKILIIPVLLLLIPVFSMLAAADRTETMTSVESAGLTGLNWMDGIADSRYLHEINIPGTHDSAMYREAADKYHISEKAYQNGEEASISDAGALRDFTLTQSRSITDQLNAGIRLLEIGITDQGSTSWSNYSDSNLYVCSSVRSEGSTYLFYALGQNDDILTLEALVSDVIGFLEKNPTETVLLMIRPEIGNRETIKNRTNAYLKTLESRANAANQQGILYLENGSGKLSKMPALGDCEGKIVIFSEAVDSTGFELNYGATCLTYTDSFKVSDRSFDCEPLREMTAAAKKVRLTDLIRELPKLPASDDETLESGRIIYTGARLTGTADDEEYYYTSYQLNPVLYPGYADAEGSLCSKGKHYGWVLSDFPRLYDANSVEFKDEIKGLWQTNYCYHRVTCRYDSTGMTKLVRSGDPVSRPKDPEKDGCSFAGWFTDEACTAAYDFSKPVTSDLTLYGKWIKNCTVTFNRNYSGAPAADTVQVKPGDAVQKPETPTRDGYTFDGWYTDQACQNKYDFSTPVSQDLTLYAAWTCTFSFESNGGTAVDSQEIRTGGTAAEPARPTKNGLTFAGWYSNSSLTYTYDFKSKVTKATTVYAKWTALVTFGSNGGTGTMNPVTVNEGQQYSLPTCYFTPPRGHKFDGWDLGPAGTKIEITGPVSLQAQWKEVGGNSASYTGNYNVTFYTNGGSSIPSQSIPYGQAVTRPADPVRQGYEFDNWYTDGTYSTAYDFQSPVTTSLTLYAKWLSSEYYTISFDANGGSGWMESVRVDRGSSYVLPGCNFTAPAGKRFVRWNFGPAGESMNVNSDMILVAQWGAVQDETPAVIYHYTVRFDTGGGSEVPEQTVESGNCAVQPENPTRRGFIFDGWYSDIAREVPYDFLEEVTSDMTLYCGWISGVLTGEISYRITNGEDQQYEKGSDRDVIIVVKRSWDDDSCYTHFTNVVLDNRVLSRYRDYTAASGSTIITFDRSFLDGTENGLHTVRIVFNDGSVETTLRIGGEDQETTTSTEPQSHEEDSPVTGDPSAEDMPMWVSLLVLSACAAICLLIVLYMKKAAAKQAEKKGGKNEF